MTPTWFVICRADLDVHACAHSNYFRGMFVDILFVFSKCDVTDSCCACYLWEMKWFNICEQHIRNTLFLMRKDKYRHEAIQQRRIYVLQTMSKPHVHVYATTIVM